jgi:hypothetical protein
MRAHQVAACVQVDSIAVLISCINLLMTQDPPPRLDAYGHLIKAPKPPDPDDPFPSSPVRVLPPSNAAAPVSDGWLFTAVGKFCLEYLQSPDSPLAAEASRALLHLKWLHSIVKFPRLQVRNLACPLLFPHQRLRTLLSMYILPMTVICGVKQDRGTCMHALEVLFAGRSIIPPQASEIRCPECGKCGVVRTPCMCKLM